MRKWIRQEPGKNNCGQIAVAVITGKTVEEVSKVIGKKGCTKTKDLIKALRHFGYNCPNKCKKMSRPRLGIGQLHDTNRKSGWHWIVVDGNQTFDGIWGDPNGYVYMWPSTFNITSYLPITKRD